MVRGILKGLCFGALVFAVVLYASYLQTGVVFIPEIKNPFSSSGSLSKALPILDQGASMEPLPKPETALYKWRSAGRWHYGHNPPEGVKYYSVDPTQQSQ